MRVCTTARLTPVVKPVRLTRRRILATGVAFFPSLPSGAAAVGDWTSPGLAKSDPEGPPARFVELPSGVRIQEVEVGRGQSVENGDRVEIDYVLRRSNGYFIYATVEGVSFQPRDIPIGPVDVTVGSRRVIAGLSDALTGMKTGGRRRVVVPPNCGYAADLSLEPQPPTYSTKRQLFNHANEPLLFEVALLRRRP